MKKKFIEKSLNLILEYKSFSDEEIEKLKYGLEGIYLTVTKLIVIFILAFLIGKLKEVILLLIFFNIIRFFAFGMHANSSTTCLIFSTIIIFGIPYLLYWLNPTELIKGIICLLTILSFVLFAPADTVKRPLTNKEKRLKRKTAAVITSIIFSIIILITKNNDISLLMLCALIIESILINPLTYKAFNMPYANYKKYSERSAKK